VGKGTTQWCTSAGSGTSGSDMHASTAAALQDFVQLLALGRLFGCTRHPAGCRPRGRHPEDAAFEDDSQEGAVLEGRLEGAVLKVLPRWCTECTTCPRPAREAGSAGQPPEPAGGQAQGRRRAEQAPKSVS